MAERNSTASADPVGSRRRGLAFVDIAVLVFIAIGAGFLLSSGRADDFVTAGVKGLLLLALLPSLLLLVYLLVASLRRSRLGANGSRLRAGGIAIAWLLVIAGFHVTDRRTAETMARGDRLIGMIEAHRERTGAYPSNLAELTADGVDIPEPALAGSAFLYFSDAEHGYRLVFAAPGFLLCTRTAALGRWYCDD